MSHTPDRTDWSLVALLFAAGLLAAGQFAKISLTLPNLAATFGRDVDSVAVLVSLTSVIGVIFGATAGSIVARYGTRRMMLGALLLGGGVSLIQAGLPAYPLFFASRVLEGLSHLVIVVAAPAAMSAAARPADQSVVMGIWGMFFGVSFALAAQILPPLLESGGLPLPLAGHALALLVVAAALFLRMPRVGPAARMAGAGLLRDHIAIYGSLRTAAPALAFVWHTLSFVALVTFVPPILGWGGTAFPLISLAGTFAAGVLARRIDPLRLATGAFAVSAVLAVGVAVLPGAAPLCVAYFLSNGLIPGASFAAIPALNETPGGRARASGALAQMGNIGTASGTPLFALTLGGGLTGLLALAAVLAVCGACLIFLIHRKISAAT